jgi:hypothetical protein
MSKGRRRSDGDGVAAAPVETGRLHLDGAALAAIIPRPT